MRDSDTIQNEIDKELKIRENLENELNDCEDRISYLEDELQEALEAEAADEEEEE